MSRRLVPVMIIGCLGALVLICYGRALFRGEQFAYRDAAHFYYPLYQRVQAEWEAGRWPLWEPEENAGMPLLGNPTAAVFYPGKVIYAVLPYPWAARVYIVAHSLLAFATMFLLARSWGISATGAGLAALGYAFGMPVLFQYCNIIFLVGAAWLPLGFRGADRWLRLGRRWGLIELTLVVAMQTMGGDPEAAYMLGLAAAGYAVALGGPAWLRSWPSRRVLLIVLPGVGVLWVAATLGLAAWLPRLRAPRPPGKPPLALPWASWVPPAVALLWGMLGLFLLWRWRRRRWRSRLESMLAGLLAAGALAAALAAVQLLPVLEFTGQSGRAAGQGPHDLFPFSLEIVRLAEFVWPNFFGTHFRGNTGWLTSLAPFAGRAELWIPSLYLGEMTLALGLAAAGLRRGPAWRGWLTAVAAVSLLASLGEFTGPLWWVRWIPRSADVLGPHDPYMTTIVRLDGYLRDGEGSFYWLLATLLPGFRQFRYPSKLLTFTAMGLSPLCGLGWDELVRADRDRRADTRRRLLRLAGGLIAVSALVWVAISIRPGPILETLERRSGRSGSVFGPLDAAGALTEVRHALLQAGAVLAFLIAVARWGDRSPGLAGILALLVCTADLALANGRAILTVPQELMETTPRVVNLIAEAERSKPMGGPFRVHRMPVWDPVGWKLLESRDRVREFVTWERDTIQPKYGISYGVQYTESLGVAELYDYVWFFGGFLRSINEETATMLRAKAGDRIVVFPRRAFDLWNTRYFVLPLFPGDWKDEKRGYASFLPDTQPIYPLVDKSLPAEEQKREREKIQSEDFQVLRNVHAYPRAWVVHSAKLLEPLSGLERTDRDARMEEILFANDYLWHDPEQAVYDPHTMAWVELERHRQAEILPYLPGMSPRDSEAVTVTHYSPQRVELDATLEYPGLLVLADVYYPGWRLTIDGVPAPIYRTNRMMRGAAVGAGRHHLVYTYEPTSFVVGGCITLGALTVLAALCALCSRRPIAMIVLPAETSPSPSASRSKHLPHRSSLVD